jgi:predicted DNA-binding protein
MKATLSIRLEDDLARALDDAARRTGHGKGRIVKDALRAYMSATTETSALAALASVSGIVRGPRDLSTNEKHLAGLGRRGRVGKTAVR